ncbi:molybdopterin oxidoreductase [Piscicoccus intestinalis]|uniref:molybdopterin oxidoreductase n=1 Tax=Piscicoccus intestinalis TaxID=746033 RepID=UPI00083833AE|nr:molybdopterin oxidoreductase [Piscicoccus intestinalis]
MLSKNVFLQGIFSFSGQGLSTPELIDESLTHRVPDGVVNQALYFRGGNTSDDVIVVSLVRDGAVMRLFPIGARADTHVPLRVVEDIIGGSEIALHVAAPAGVDGQVVVDLGMVEV